MLGFNTGWKKFKKKNKIQNLLAFLLMSTFQPQLAKFHKFTNAAQRTIFICPIAIAYSIGQIIKPVCVCQSITFLDRFSPKLAQM